MYVLDASVTMAWCFEDEQAALAERALDLLLEDEALVPPLWVYEIANVVAVAQRRERLTEAAATRFVDLLQQLPIVVAGEPDLAALVDAARRHELSAYDGGYLTLAAQHGLPLATLDERLSARAVEAGVQLLA